jgi:hypothetical protein
VNGKVEKVLMILRNYYGKDGRPLAMNDVQIGVYLSRLERFSAAELERAATAHMESSAFFPKLSDLLALLDPPVDPKVAAMTAWTTLETAIRRAGCYRGATFADGAIGECARQVFGSWASACSFDTDSPGWAIRRQTFLTLYPSLAGKHPEPVTMAGLFPHELPLMIGQPPDGYKALQPPKSMAELDCEAIESLRKGLTGRSATPRDERQGGRTRGITE